MPKLIDHQEREVAVAEAAWRVLEREGVRGLSVRTVAEEAGLSVGSLRRSFPSQFTLLTFCIRLVADRVGDRIRALPQDGIMSWATRAVEEVLPLDDARRLEVQVWLALSMEALADPDLRRVCDQVDRELAELMGSIADLVSQGRATDVDRSELHAVVDGLAIHLVRQEPDQEVEWARAVVVRSLERLAAL